MLTAEPDPLRNAPTGGILSSERRVSRWDFSACVPGQNPDGHANDTRSPPDTRGRPTLRASRALPVSAENGNHLDSIRGGNQAGAMPHRGEGIGEFFSHAA